MPPKRERQTRELMRHYLLPSVIEQVRAPQELQPAKFNATVLQIVFHNLYDLEHVGPNIEQHVTHVNAYTDPLITTAQAQAGLVDIVVSPDNKMQVIFGNPLNQSTNHHAVDAVYAALSMQNLLQEVHRARRGQGLPLLSVGIGIQTGEVIYAKLGGERQFRFGHLGRPIDESREIADRTEEEDGAILLGTETERYVRELVETEVAFTFTPEGREEPMTVYRVIKRKESAG